MATNTSQADASSVDVSYLRRCRRLTIAYVAFHVVLLVGVVAVEQWRIVSGFYSPILPWVWGGISVAVAHSQLALAAIWIALGGPLQPWRLLIATVGVCALVAFPGLGIAEHAYRELSHAFGLQVFINAGILLLVRFAYVALIDLRRGEETSLISQFSVASLLLWTTIWCLVLGLSRALPPLKLGLQLLTSERSFAPMCGAFAAVAVVASWSALSNVSAPIRGGVFVLTCATLFVLSAPVFDDRFWNTPWRWQLQVPCWVVYPPLIVIWLVPLRWMGYRFQRDMAISLSSRTR